VLIAFLIKRTLDIFTTIVTMAETPTTPTTNGVKTPVTPQQHYGGFSLTEYSAQPSPPSSTPKTEEAKVPKEFLLPSGYPDVCV